MTAPVRIEAEAWSDLRFATLARLLNLADLDHALIKVARIWSWQAEHYTPDEPTYLVDAELIESALGPGGADALVRSRLAEWVADSSAGGYPGGLPSGYRMRGTEGRIEWLWQRRSAALKGGQANKRRLANKPKPSGYPSGLAPGLAVGIAIPEPNPSPLPPALVPEELSLSRTIPSVPTPVPVEGAWARYQRWWALMRDAHRRLRNKGIEPNAPDLAKVCAGEHERNVITCERGLRDGGFGPDEIEAKVRHAIAIVEIDCERDTTLKYMAPALLWEPSRFNRSVDTTVAQAKAGRGNQRAGPRSANGAEPPKPIRKMQPL